eukprot:TRINITY_DN6463_c0_g1_i1.p2 TRINITY_DN6463_c0_g1~~TRINITY_DN6463_c0_g1_i1.p2  ORF type:complete len:180 (-),score=31.34 TRINITY_DN6463_c0_g1_i1:107-646(-)
MLPALCQIGNCIPSPKERFLTDIPTKLHVSACTQRVKPPTVRATNGCDVWDVTPQTDIVTKENSKNATIYHTWTLNSAHGSIGAGGQENLFLSQVVEVIDEPPKFQTDLSDISVTCEAFTTTPPEMDAIDDCDGDVPIQYSEMKSSSNCPFVVYRQWSAEDSFGQVSNIHQLVRVGFSN